MAVPAQRFAAGLERQQQQLKAKQKQKQRRKQRQGRQKQGQQQQQQQQGSSSELVEDTEPLLKELLSEAVQRVAGAVDDAYDAALRSALEEFRLVVPAQAADETPAAADSAAAAADSTAADATAAADGATTDAAAVTASVVAAPVASFLSASPGDVGAALLLRGLRLDDQPPPPPEVRSLQGDGLLQPGLPAGGIEDP